MLSENKWCKGIQSARLNTFTCKLTAIYKQLGLSMDFTNTVELLNQGHFGNRPFVLCSEVQLYNPQMMF